MVFQTQVDVTLLMKLGRLLSDGTLIATLYAVKWMLENRVKGEHECPNDVNFTMKWRGRG